MYITNNI